MSYLDHLPENCLLKPGISSGLLAKSELDLGKTKLKWGTVSTNTDLLLACIALFSSQGVSRMPQGKILVFYAAFGLLRNDLLTSTETCDT